MLVKINSKYRVSSGECFTINGILYVLLGILNGKSLNCVNYSKHLNLVNSTGREFNYNLSIEHFMENDILIFRKYSSFCLLEETTLDVLSSDDFSNEYTVIDYFKWRRFCKNNFVKVSDKYKCMFLVDEFSRNKFVVKCALSGKKIFNKVEEVEI